MIVEFGLLFQTLVSAGYTPPPAITIAPGQVIPLLVTGLKTVLPNIVRADKVPLPTTLAGISVSLQQSFPAKSWQLPIFAVEQYSRCATAQPTADCLVTAVSVQIPYDIVVPNPVLGNGPIAQGFTTVTVSEDGTPSGSFLVQPVSVQLHILTSCDIGSQTESAGTCFPLVAHADGTLVLQDVRVNGQPQTHTEAQPGEELVMYAYGLGAVSSLVTAGTASPVPAAVATQPFDMHFTYSPQLIGIAQTSARLLPRPIHPLFAGLTPGLVGLYQINFVVPPVPSGTPACGAPLASNLIVLVTAEGQSSSDSAGICVDPGGSAQ